MLDWDEPHPYNAVHIVRVHATLDIPRLREAIQATLAGLGLTNMTVGSEGGDFHFGGGPVISEIILIEGGAAAATSLATEIERQINTPFPRSGPFAPFRFFVVPGQTSFSLGLAYFHPVADAESIVGLLKRMVDAYRASATGIAPATAELSLEHPASPIVCQCKSALRQIAALPSFIKILRTSSRPRYRDAEDLRNGFTNFSLDAAALGCLRTAAKSWGVTLNDLFLTLLMNSIAPLAEARKQARRRSMTAGCIVNVRKDLGISPGTFGLFLGSFMVTHEVPEGIGVKELASAIAHQTARIKARRTYLSTTVQLAFASLALRFFSTRRKRSFYQKHFPLWGGITNMNLNPLWDGQTPEDSLDYLRAVSTGPVTPLVLSVTTSGERVNVGLSYRSTVFSAAEIEQVQRRLIEGVTSLANLS